MKGVTPVEGTALGYRVVRADRQVVAGLVYYLQIELWTATRCEVHERRVYVDLQVCYIFGDGEEEKAASSRLAPACPNPDRCDFLTTAATTPNHIITRACTPSRATTSSPAIARSRSRPSCRRPRRRGPRTHSPSHSRARRRQRWRWMRQRGRRGAGPSCCCGRRRSGPRGVKSGGDRLCTVLGLN